MPARKTPGGQPQYMEQVQAPTSWKSPCSEAPPKRTAAIALVAITCPARGAGLVPEMARDGHQSQSTYSSSPWGGKPSS